MNKKQFFSLGGIILVLNLIWEFSHYRLYLDLTGIPSTRHLIMASIMDVFLVFLIFFFISMINKNWNWTKKPDKKDYFLIILFGLMIALTIEIINLGLGRWAYTEAMPLIFGIGLSPLIQLFVTGILALMIFRKIHL